MMQRWCTAVLLGTTLLGCQLEPSQASSESTQELSTASDACSAKLPDSSVWNGKPPPAAQPGEVWVFVPSSRNLAETTAALVEPVGATIRFLTLIPKGQKGGFLNDIDNASLAVFTGHPNPPPPATPPWLLVFEARRIVDSQVLVQQDVKTCEL